MKVILLLLLVLNIYSKDTIGIGIDGERITYKQIFDEDLTNYVINVEDPYEKLSKFTKEEKIINSGSYTYKWSGQDTNAYIDLQTRLPKKDPSTGLSDFSIYDTVYLNLYSAKKTGSTFIILFYCKSTDPNETRDPYIMFRVSINFEGWHELKIPLSNFDLRYSPDITKVYKIVFTASGWSQIPNPETIIYFDKCFLTKIKTIFSYEEDEIDNENYSSILKRLRYILTNSITENIDNKIVTDRLKALIRTATSVRNEMNKVDNPFNYAMTQSADMTRSFQKVLDMAIGYGIEGGELYKDKNLLKDIIYSLDYLHNNYYNIREKVPFSNDNWWDWEIGSAQFLLKILVIISDELTKESIDKYLEPFNRYNPLPVMTMSNRINIAYSTIFAGVLQHDYKRIALSVEMLRECFDTVEKGDGFYDDGSFIQHDYYPYIGGYGSSMIIALTTISFSLNKSIFRFDDEMKDYQYNWVINSYLPFMYNGGFLDLVRGREITRKSNLPQTGKAMINSLCLLSDYLTDSRNALYIKSVLKNIYSINYSYLKNSLDPVSLIVLEKIKEDNSISEENIHNFAKVYSRMDRAISQINGIAIGISFSSTRIGKYESINNENTKGWYTGDGMTYIYLDMDDYCYSYWNEVNPYHIPGTTVTKAPRKEVRSFSVESLSTNDFAGGAYYDIYLVSGIKFESDINKLGFSSSLVGNKAYFVFKDKLICLGNSINSEDDYEVETIIENRKLKGEMYIGDEKITENNGNIENKYIYIEEYGGIVLSSIKNAKFEIMDNKFFEIYINHGKKIKDEVYSYMIFPKCEREEMKKLEKRFEILENNKIVSAVYDNDSGISQYVFWSKGKLNNIEVDNPCIFIMNDFEAYIAEPTQKIESITLIIDGVDYNVKLTKGYTQLIKILKLK